MSIRPAGQDDIEQITGGPKGGGAGKKTEEDTSKAGIGFMDLIQYHVE